MIYLDNAATTLHKPPEVAEAVKNAILTAGNASRGAHGVSLAASRMVFDTRARLAKLFGCPRADHVVFTANSTEALNIALYGLISAGDHVISTDLEHNSVLRPLYDLQTRGAAVDFVPADKKGNIRYEDMQKLFRPDTKAVVCTHASNLIGNVLDIARIGEMAHAHGALLVVDASQTAGVLPIDMQKMHIDVLCFTGHKGLMGPQGTGGLCIRPGVEVQPLLRGGTGIHSYDRGQPQAYPARLEAGTLNTHGLAGLHAALEFIERHGVQAIGARERALMRRFYDGVRGIPGIAVYGDFEQDERAAIVTLNIRDYASGEVADALFEDCGIATRAGAHCAPRMHEALGTVEQGAVRFSFAFFNTEDEVDMAVRAVRELAE
ncbi:aminotransferase class V-fold PLP-dependent enzyme [uncultured Agathobaculum sp.]|uniref:aminotransferase class V-fold PLP-dependent enzyme n=1 Tax=uncultured Agathobaculum sp. TaxID=2048140 RepID=UPI00296F8130